MHQKFKELTICFFFSMFCFTKIYSSLELKYLPIHIKILTREHRDLIFRLQILRATFKSVQKLYSENIFIIRYPV